jgi:Icc-related predicted phosphoesterase
VVRVLAVSDVVVEWLWSPAVRDVEADLIVACGDLPAEYLEYLVTVGDVPLLWVPGNHDAESGPSGCLDVDGTVIEVGGLRAAGLGGSIRYRPGPNQYTERQMRRRCRALARHSGRRLDLFIAHAPPRGIGDGADPPHRGFEAFLDLLDALQPRVMLHGHVHPYGPHLPDHRRGESLVVNAIPHRVLDL